MVSFALCHPLGGVPNNEAMELLELIANSVNAASVILAARNSIHTWWIGIIGCALFSVLFFQAQLYADATLQLFFIATCIIGWANWKCGSEGEPLPIQKTAFKQIVLLLIVGIAVTAAYGGLLHIWTNAFAPFLDSSVLAFSVLAQLLLMRRRLETWYFWLLVDAIAVPLFASRGLYLTSALYALFFFNALYGWWQWRSTIEMSPKQ